MEEKTLTTYSMWSRFRNCRKAAYWRYVKEIVPKVEEIPALRFGKLMHECLALWHLTRDDFHVFAFIDVSYPNRGQNPDQQRDWHLATAMMRGYMTAYPTETFEIVALEHKFEGEIRNPATEALSRSFVLGGKVDGIVRANGQHFLLEHKTARIVDSGYLERLWTDFQIALYSHYIELTEGYPIAGVIYNILVKPGLQQGEGETEQEFMVRYHGLIAKSKTGKSNARRQLPETDEEFQARLAVKMAEPGMYHRELLYLSKDRIVVLRAELWELTQSFLDARRRGVFYQNTDSCWRWNRPCGYFPLCRSNGSELVIENLYELREAHEELQDEPVVETPAF